MPPDQRDPDDGGAAAPPEGAAGGGAPRGGMASRIDAMMAAALDEDEVPDEDGVDEANTGIVDPSLLEPVTGVRGAPEASPDETELLDDDSGVVELSPDELSSADLTPPPRDVPITSRPKVMVPIPDMGRS